MRARAIRHGFRSALGPQEAAHRVAQNLTKLFARIILCTVFLPAGFHAVFGQDTFTAEEAQRIQSMRSPEEAFEKVVERAKPSALRATEEEPAADTSKLRALNRIALHLDDAHVPEPMLVAWCMAWVSLVGGAAMLLGLLTRLFALPLAAVGAFHLVRVAWPEVGTLRLWAWTPEESRLIASWLAAALLPIALFLQGAGAPSADALMGRSGGKGARGKSAAKPTDEA